MRVITPYDLKPVEYANRLRSVPVGSKLKGEAVVPLRRDRDLDVPMSKFRLREDSWIYSPDGLPSQELVSYYHLDVADGFSSRTGLFKSLDEVAGFESHRVRLARRPGNTSSTEKLPNWSNWPHLGEDLGNKLAPQRDIEWRTNRMELIGLLLEKEPRVYVSDNLPNMEELSSSDVETRQLNSFEKDALKQLQTQAEEETVISATKNRILMVGAIRASNSCLQCHNAKEGDMMGAFSYEFLRHPKVK